MVEVFDRARPCILRWPRRADNAREKAPLECFGEELFREEILLVPLVCIRGDLFIDESANKSPILTVRVIVVRTVEAPVPRRVAVLQLISKRGVRFHSCHESLGVHRSFV